MKIFQHKKQKTLFQTLDHAPFGCQENTGKKRNIRRTRAVFKLKPGQVVNGRARLDKKKKKKKKTCSKFKLSSRSS